MLRCNSRETNQISLVGSICSFRESQEKGEDVRDLRKEVTGKLLLYRCFHDEPPYDLVNDLVAIGFFYKS